MDKEEQKKDDKKGLYIPKQVEEDKPSPRPAKKEKQPEYGIIKVVAKSYLVVNVDGNNIRVQKDKVSGKLAVGEKVRIK